MTSTMDGASLRTTAPPNLPRAVFLGDSQAEGLSPHMRTALADMFYVVGTSWQRGISTRAMLRSGKVEASLAQNPRVVIFALGGNDTASDSYADDLVALVGLAARDGAHVVWIGPARSADPEVDARHAAAREVQRAILPTLGVLWLDSAGWTNSGHAPDGVHFTRPAYAAQAAEIAQALRDRRAEIEGGGGTPLLAAALILGGGALAGAIWWASRR